MTRKCSHCGHNGHNSRTCPNRGVKLFGVRLTDGASSSSSSSSSVIRKSASMGNLNLLHFASASASASSPSSLHSHAAAGCGVSAVPVENPEASLNGEGYLSDGLVHNSSSAVNARSERKKGVPWTEEEHRMFLIGLQKLGKGDWRGISRNYVPSRTPTQVASHAQKYFIRQNNLTRRKRRSSLFDITAEAAGPRSSGTSNSSRPIMLSPNNPVSAAPVTSAHSTSEQEEAESAQNSPTKPMDTDSTAAIQETLAPAATASDASASAAAACGYGPGEMVAPAAGMFQGFVAAASSPYLPFVFPVWASVRPSSASASASASVSSTTVYRPTAVVPTAPIKMMDDCTGLSQLSLAENNSISTSATSPVGPPPPSPPPPPPCWPAMEPSELSLKLHDTSSTRQSAFQAADKTSFGSTTNVISVV